MAQTSNEVLVLVDAEGNYYALPRQLIERARVPEEHKLAIEALRRQQGLEMRLRAITRARALKESGEETPAVELAPTAYRAGLLPGPPAWLFDRLPEEERSHPMPLGWFRTDPPHAQASA